MRPPPLLTAIGRWSTGLLRACLLGRVPGLFDAGFYRRTYPAVERTGMDPYLHYAAFGARRGYDPAEDFDTAFYVRQSGRTWRTPVGHYAAIGVLRGLDPNPRFNTLAYLGRYPDVRQAGANPLLHHREYGRREGRVAEPSVLERTARPALSSAPTREIVCDDPPFSLTLDRGLAEGDGWQVERRVAIRLCLTSGEFEQLHRALLLLGPACAVRLHIGGAPDRRPASTTAVLVLDACLCRRTAGALAVRYAEVRLWDLRPSDPKVACIDAVGRITCTMPDERAHMSVGKDRRQGHDRRRLGSRS